jgi:hypothetical protein
MPKDLVINNGKLETTKLVGAPNVRQINYILNPDAEVDTTGWATYADAAGTSPVDGTGGTAQTNLWTRTTSSPVRGSSSFKLDKTGTASRQGQGVSYDFTIDKADQAKVLTISFDYEVLSGTYANGDLQVWIYDVSNSTMIQPAGYTLQSVSVGTENKHIATFQTSASGTSYRLILHVSSTSALDYALAIDNVVVGPQTVQYGAALTDWVSFTPTGSLSTNTTYSAGRWRRVGDSAEIQYLITFSGDPGTGYSTPTVNMPSGMVIDTSKLTDPAGRIVNLGTCFYRRASDTYNGIAGYDSTTTLILYGLRSRASGTGVDVAAIADGFPSVTDFASGDWIYVSAKVPVAGWSSTVQMSSDTDTRVVVFTGALITTSISSGTIDVPKIIVPAVSLDTHGAYNASTGVYTVPVPGFYRLTHRNTMAMEAGKLLRVGVAINGTSNFSKMTQLTNGSSSSYNLNPTFSDVFFLNAGDLVRFCVSHDNSSATSLFSDSRMQCYSIERVSGPSAIAATETVNEIWTNSAGTALGATGVVVTTPYATKVASTHGAWNGTTFTAPVSGTYMVTANVAMFVPTTSTLGGTGDLFLNKSGSAFAWSRFVQSTANTINSLSASRAVQLLAGEQVVVTMRMYYNGATTPTLYNDAAINTLTITRVGN